MEVAMKMLSTFAVLLLTLPASSQTSSPVQEKTLFHNEYVTVYQVTLKPGEKTPEHATGDRLIYSLSSYSLSYHWGDRTSTEKRKAGDLHFHPDGKHVEENSGKTTASFLIAERSSTPLPKTELTGLDMAKASPFNTAVIFDREMAKVFEVTLQPKDAVAMHFGLDRVVYALTPFELSVVTPDGKKMVEKGKKGSLSWHPAGLHSVENHTAEVVKLLVFGFKR
jgi:uncharacterized RmlC-like cupin family protein